MVSLPYGMAKSGWAGLVPLAIITFYEGFTMYLLTECLQVMAELPGKRTIGSIAAHAFGEKMGLLAAAVVLAVQTVCTAECFVIIAVHLQLFLGWQRHNIVVCAAVLALCQTYGSMTGVARVSALGAMCSSLFVVGVVVCASTLPSLADNTVSWAGVDGIGNSNTF